MTRKANKRIASDGSTATGRPPSNPNLQNLPVRTQKISKELVEEIGKNATPMPVPVNAYALLIEALDDRGDKHEEFLCPESSNVHGAVYLPDSMVCHIFFGNPTCRSQYRFGNAIQVFTPGIWEDFKGCESKGKFFSSFIQPNFKGELIWKEGQC